MNTSKYIKYFLISVFILSVQITTAQWENISTGMGNKQVFSLFNNSSNIFAGTSTNGLYLSTDNGSSWNPAGINYFNTAYAITEFGNYLYAATELGVWRTSNNGAYWSYTSLNNTTMYSLASNQTRVFAGSHNSGLFYSSGGTGWFISSLNTSSIKSLAINGDFVVAGCGNAAGVYISTNNGTNWTSTALNNKTVYSLALNGNNIFAGTGSGVYYSNDNGTTWTHSSLNNELVYSLAVNGNNVFAGTELHGVYVSSNNGISWIQKNEGLGNITIYSLRIINNFIFAGGSVNGVYRRQLGDLVGVPSISNEIPNDFTLTQNYPNPFNPSTNISFSIPKSETVNLIVYDAAGREAAVLVNEHMNAGNYEVTFNTSGLSSGVYFYKLTTGVFNETKRMVLIK